MTKLYIIRHAEAEGNLYRRIHGHYDSIVTDTGMLQLEKLRERFEGVDIDAVYSSDLLRTRSTAKAIAEPKGLGVITLPKLREVNMGVWEDMTWGDVAVKWPRELELFNSNPDRWSIEGSESTRQVVGRMLPAILDIAKRHDGQSVAIVTHGSVSRQLFAHMLGIPSEEILSVGMSDNTAVSLLIAQGDQITIEYKNDNSHLPFELSIFSKQKWHRSKNGDDGFNMRYKPMDLHKAGDRYMRYRRDGWMAAHGTMAGFTEEYYDLALKHQSEHPMAVSEVYMGEKPVGVVEMDTRSFIQQGAGSIAYCYLTEEKRFAGLGVQLIGQAVSVYLSLGRERLRLCVAEENESALRFYKKYGFQTVGQTGGALGRLNVMEKDIARKVR